MCTLIILASCICALLTVLGNYEVNLLEDIKLSAIVIGYAGAIESLISALASKGENKFNSTFRNKSLTVLALTLSMSALVEGICGVTAIRENIIVGMIFTIIFISTNKYMKTRVGLKPEEYSKEERKYDELKEIEKV